MFCNNQDFLYENGFYESLITLEREADSNFRNYHEDIKILKKIILKGYFSKAEESIKSVRKFNEQGFLSSMKVLAKTQLLEALDNESESEIYVSKLLDNYKTIASKSEYEEITDVIKALTIRKHPNYTNWSVMQGRLSAFYKIRENLMLSYPEQASERKLPHNAFDNFFNNLKNETGKSFIEHCTSDGFSKEKKTKAPDTFELTAAFKTDVKEVTNDLSDLDKEEYYLKTGFENFPYVCI